MGDSDSKSLANSSKGEMGRANKGGSAEEGELSHGAQNSTLSDKELTDIFNNRSWFYMFFGMFYADAPTKYTFDNLQEFMPYFIELSNDMPNLPPLGFGVDRLQRCLANVTNVDEFLEDQKVEYDKLFKGEGAIVPALSSYISSYKSSDELIKLFDDNNFGSYDFLPLVEDHITSLLLFMHFLSANIGFNLSMEKSDEAVKSVQISQIVMDKYLLSWIPMFSDDLINRSNSDDLLLVEGITETLHGYLIYDKIFLDNTLE